MITKDNYSCMFLCSVDEGKLLRIADAYTTGFMAKCAITLNRTTLLISYLNGLYKYDISFLYHLDEMTLAQAKACWKFLEEVIKRQSKIEELDAMAKLIEQCSLKGAQQENYWHLIGAIYENEKRIVC